MVLPLDIGNPINTFVKVIGSGVDLAAEATCCDLSSVANLHPAAPLPQHLKEPVNCKRKLEDCETSIQSKKPKGPNNSRENLPNKAYSSDTEYLREKICELQKKNQILENRLALCQRVLKDPKKLSRYISLLDHAQTVQN